MIVNLKNYHLEVCRAFLSTFFICFKTSFSLSWLTCALGNLLVSPYLGLGLSSSREERRELLMVMLLRLSTADNWELFLLLSIMASATSLTGRLKAARYSFLDYIPWEWYWLIYSMSLISSSSSLLSSLLMCSFSLPIWITFLACSV